MPRKAGRPQKELPGELVYSLAKLGCTLREIAGVLKCSPTTVSNRFQAELERGQDDLKMSLRRRQVELALGGNATMLIWLGKMYLGQADKVRTDITTGGQPVGLTLAELEALAKAHGYIEENEPAPANAAALPVPF